MSYHPLHLGQNGHHQNNLQTINVGEDLEKRKPSSTIDGNVNWYSHCTSQKMLKENFQKSSPISGYIPRENHNSKSYLYPNVHFNTANNSLEAILVYSNKGMDRDAVYLYNGKLLSSKKE